MSRWPTMDRPWDRNSDRPQSVVVFSLAPLWSPHFETELELILQHTSIGDRVTVVHCEAELGSCLANPSGNRFPCFTCRSRAARGFDTVGLDPALLLPLDLRPIEVPQFSTLHELMEYRHRGVAIGRAAASSLISILRDPRPDVAAHADLAETLASTAAAIYDSSARLLSSMRPDLTYVFNGRFASTQPIIEACRVLGLEFATHEAGYEVGTYRLVRNGTVHELEVMKHQMHSTWDSGRDEPETRGEIAREFFVGRRYGGHGDSLEEYQFARSQTRDFLGKLQDRVERQIVIFNSSEDEFAAAMSFRNPVFADQMDALDAIVRHPWPSSWRIVLRVHPNLIGVDNHQTARIDALAANDDLAVVPAASPVDSYALIDNSDVVVTFGSTIGAEAMYWGKPSVLVGRAIYEELGTQRPSTPSQVMAAIADGSLSAPDRDAVLRFGYFQRRWNTPFQHFTQDSFRSGLFNGQLIRPSRRAQAVSLASQAAESLGEPDLRSELRRRVGRASRQLIRNVGPSRERGSSK